MGIKQEINQPHLQKLPGFDEQEHEEYLQSIHGQTQSTGFLKISTAKRAGKSLNLSRNQLRILKGSLTGHSHSTGHLFKNWTGKRSCDRCKQAHKTAPHVLCDCEALATLRFRHLGHHFVKPGDSEDISISRILHVVHGEGLMNV
jgi:hypothetical protein